MRLISSFIMLCMLCINTTQAQSLNEYLERYHYCELDVQGCAGLGYLPSDPNIYNESAKERLLALLKNKWSEQEKEDIANLSLQSGIKNSIKGMERALHDTINYDFGSRRRGLLDRLDSLKMLMTIQLDTFPPYINALNEMKKTLKNSKVSRELILVAGFLGDQRYISALKETMNDSIHYDHSIVRLALGRNSVEPYYEDVLKINAVDLPHSPPKDPPGIPYDPLTDFSQRSSNLIYLASQESIKELAKWLNMTGNLYKYEVISHSDIYATVGQQAVLVLRKAILNKDFQDHFSIDTINYDAQNVTLEDLKFTKKWIKENYGRYEIDKSDLPSNVTGRLTYNY